MLNSPSPRVEKPRRRFVMADSLKLTPPTAPAYPRSSYDDAEQIAQARQAAKPAANTDDLLSAIRAAKELVG